MSDGVRTLRHICKIKSRQVLSCDPDRDRVGVDIELSVPYRVLPVACSLDLDRIELHYPESSFFMAARYFIINACYFMQTLVLKQYSQIAAFYYLSPALDRQVRSSVRKVWADY